MKIRIILAGITLGAIVGYLYYFWIGCSTGTCAITSHPVNATLYGALMGGLLSNTFSTEDDRDGGSNQR